MKNFVFGLALAVASGVSAQAAVVESYTLSGVTPSSFWSNIWFTYLDADDNDLMSLDEITGFSGVLAGGVLYTDVSQVAEVPGFSLSSWGDPFFSGYFEFTRLLNQDSKVSQFSAGRDVGPVIDRTIGSHFNWTFTQVSNLPAVPLPAGMPLLLAGLGALAAFRLRRARG